MTIVTLTTDLGLRDYYVPSVKGFLYGALPEGTVVDITHQVKPFNIAEAAFILSNTYFDFPKGTIHLASVESDQDNQSAYLMAEIEGHYFFAKDNGLISLITEKIPNKLIKLHASDNHQLKFPLKNLLAKTAAEFAGGAKPESLGTPEVDMVMRTHIRPILMENIIRGTVIYVDNFGNVITNIHQSDLDRYPEVNQVKVNYSRNEYINRIRIHYEEVPEGEKICLFGTNGYLEIAINKGNASQLLGLYNGQTIILELS